MWLCSPQGGLPSRLHFLRTLPARPVSPRRERGSGCAVAALSLWRGGRPPPVEAWPCFSGTGFCRRSRTGGRPHLCKQLRKGRREVGFCPRLPPGQGLPGVASALLRRSRRGDRSGWTLNSGPSGALLPASVLVYLSECKLSV